MKPPILFLAVLSLLAVNPADACTCSVGLMLWGGFSEASHVFEGTVTQIKTEELPSTLLPIAVTTVTFRVMRVWKGEHSREVTVETNPNEASCGYEFKLGDPYVVYAFSGSSPADRPGVGLCSRTKGGRWRFYERILLGPASWRAQ